MLGCTAAGVRDEMTGSNESSSRLSAVHTSSSRHAVALVGTLQMYLLPDSRLKLDLPFSKLLYLLRSLSLPTSAAEMLFDRYLGGCGNKQWYS